MCTHPSGLLKCKKAVTADVFSTKKTTQKKTVTSIGRSLIIVDWTERVLRKKTPLNAQRQRLSTTTTKMGKEEKKQNMSTIGIRDANIEGDLDLLDRLVFVGLFR